MEIDTETEAKEEQVENSNDGETKQATENAKAAEHIRELLAIDKDVAKCLEAAGQAVKSLTSADAEDDKANFTLEDAKETFEQQTIQYYTLVQSIAARLRRQIYALEEADMIAPNQSSMQQQAAPPAAPPSSRPNTIARNTGARTGTTAAAMQQQRVEAPMEITNGGLGKFDVGWLNSRGDQVGKTKEAELWAQARQHLENMQTGTQHGTDAAEDMEIA